MATTVRRGDVAGKEKKGISPSTTSVVTKKSTKPSTSSFSSHGDKKTISPSNTKQVPNYLKPTKSSTHELSRLSKKPNIEPSNTKPTLNRRKSFDHPPPPSQVQKATRGAKFGRSSSTLKTTPQSSSSSKPTFSERLPVRNVEPHLSTTRSNLKKSTLSNTTTTTTTTCATKKGPTKGTSSTKKAPKSVTSESKINIDRPSCDRLAIDDLVNLDHDEVQSLPEISEMPASGNDLGDPTNLEDEVKEPNEEDHDEDMNMEDVHQKEDISIVASQVIEEPTTHDVTNFDDQDEEKQLDDQKRVEESTNQQEQIEGGEQNPIEEGVEDQDGVDQEVEKDDIIETISKEEKEDESPKKDDEKMEKEIEKTTKTNANDENVDANSRNPHVANIVTTKAPIRTQSIGKKENQAYNDVIEATASKLMSKKNKVLALAGAFETVISLQETNKN